MLVKLRIHLIDWRFLALILASLFFVSSRAVFGASALDQIRPASNLPEIDLRQIEKGDVVGNRGSLGNFHRGVYGESVYFIHAPVATVGEKMLHWNSARHPELEIKTLREYRWPAPASSWDSLTLASAQPDDRWLLERTAQLALTTDSPTDLHLTRAEIASFRDRAHQAGNRSATEPRDTTVNAFWRKLLRDRNNALASGGLAGLPSYSADGVHIETRAEFNDLLKLAPAIAARFRALTGGPPFIAQAAPAGLEIVPYWEASLVRGHTNLKAAFLVAHKGPASWQIADCTYYTSDTYFMSVTLYELWPQDDGTIVWQTDFASAPFRSFTGGLDRVFAGNQMIKETEQTAKLFRADVEKNP